jgi:hypothetical protein
MRHMKRNIVLALVIGTVAALASVASTAITTTINDANAPGGTHLQRGAIGCTVGSDNLTVTCTGFQLNGVGNTNADLVLSASYSAIIDCRNHGGNIVESHETTFSDTSSATLTPSRNGRLDVPGQSVGPDLALAEPCPNPNWTPEFQPGTLMLDSFTYTLTFNGFTGAYITITGP